MKALVALLALVLLAGCGAAPAPSAHASVTRTTGYRVYAAVMQQSGPALAVISVPGGKQMLIPDAVLSPDASTVYSVVRKGLYTAVRALDSATGQIRAEQAVAGAYSLPTPDVDQVPAALSPAGRRLVLESVTPRPDQGTPSRSDFAVLSTSLDQPPLQIELDGWYRFDAIDDSGSSLYLLHYMPGGRGSYQVRRYDLQARRLDPNVIADKTDIGQLMSGVRVSGLYSPDGVWHLGLYARGSGVAFLHALPLSPDFPFAFCVDLPARSSDIVTQMGWAAIGTRDGSRLYAANDLLGEVLELSLPPRGRFDEPQIARRADLPKPAAVRLPGVIDAEAKELPAQRAVLSRDGSVLYFASNTGIYLIDTGTLSVRAHWLASTSFASLVPSPDGAYLFGLNGTRLDQLDARTGALTAQLSVGLEAVSLEAARSA